MTSKAHKSNCGKPEVVRNHNFRGAGRPSKFDWNAVADGKSYRLIRGVHYDAGVSANSVQANAHSAARTRNKKCRTTVEDGGNAVVVQFYKPKTF